MGNLMLKNSVQKIIIEGSYSDGEIINEVVDCHQCVIRHEAEIFVWVDEDPEILDIDEEGNEIHKLPAAPRYKISLAGSRQAFLELGGYLITLAYENKPDTSYEFTNLGVLEDKARCELVIHDPTKIEWLLKQLDLYK